MTHSIRRTAVVNISAEAMARNHGHVSQHAADMAGRLLTDALMSSQGVNLGEPLNLSFEITPTESNLAARLVWTLKYTPLKPATTWSMTMEIKDPDPNLLKLLMGEPVDVPEPE